MGRKKSKIKIIRRDVRAEGVLEGALLTACGSALHHIGRKSGAC